MRPSRNLHPALCALVCALALPVQAAVVVKLKSPAPECAAAFVSRMSERLPGFSLEPLVGSVYLARSEPGPSLLNKQAESTPFLETGLVEAAQPDKLVFPPVFPAEADAEKGWHLAKIQAPAFWERSRGSRTVKVLVCDTGIESGHPDLRGNVGTGRNFVDGGERTEPTGNGHGTRIAGLIGGQGGRTGSGAVGVNWEVQLIPGKIANKQDGGALQSDMAKCVKWGADQGIKVVNLSFSGAVDSLAVQEAAVYLREKGGILVVAAGNKGLPRELPDDPNMLVVGGTNSLDWRPPAYNTGAYVDLSAPASAMFTTDMGGKHVTSQGTSLSAAVVSGAAALILSVRPELAADALTGLLLSSTVDLGPPGRDEFFGVGRLDLKKAAALLKLGERQVPAPAVLADPGLWRLGESGGGLAFDSAETARGL